MEKLIVCISTFMIIVGSINAQIFDKLVASNELGENYTTTIDFNNFRTKFNEVEINQNLVDSPKLVLFKRAYKKIVKVGNIGIENLDVSINVERLLEAQILENYKQNKPDKKLIIYLNAKQLKKPQLIYFGNAQNEPPVYGIVPICSYPVFRLPSNFE